MGPPLRINPTSHRIMVYGYVLGSGLSLGLGLVLGSCILMMQSDLPSGQMGHTHIRIGVR